MTKSQLLALSDYVISKSDLDLKLFIMSINPLFVLKKTNKIELLSLISKWEPKQDKVRLTAIENYLKQSTKQTKTITNSPKLVVKAVKASAPEVSENQTKLNSLVYEYMQNLKNQSPNTIDRNIQLKNEIKLLQQQIGNHVSGSFDDIMHMGTDGDYESKVMLFKSIFGDWKDPNSAAWSFIHPNGKPQFSVTDAALAGMWFSIENKRQLDQLILFITGEKNQGYNVVEDNSVSPSMWVFTKGAVTINRYIKGFDQSGNPMNHNLNALENMKIAEKL